MSKSQAISSTIAKVHYTPRPGVSVTAVAVAKKGEPTTLMHEGKTYANAQVWIKDVFQNSGKSTVLQVVIEKNVGGTPRPPKQYVPPSQTCPFGRYI